jgi:glucans biosynthesis protein
MAARILNLIGLGLLTPVLSAPAATSFNVLRQRASDMAKREYTQTPPPKLPEALESIDYDQYQRVQFRPEAGPWHDKGLYFDLRFFSRGYIFRDAVKLHLIEPEVERDVQYTASMFDYPTLQLRNPLPDGLDFAGFKVLYRNAMMKSWSEVASFLGATYFRIVGKGLRYGASARALAVDTGEAAGEEFPRLTEFWIQAPEPQASHLEVMALVDSPSVAGACRFIFNVADQTSTEVEVSFFPRGKRKFGIAPLTSMFLVGENRTRYVPDFRPEVHDSDGLLVIGVKGQRLWRPLENPEKRHRITRFPLPGITGFGLMQRDRTFQSYEDLEGRYDLRPSLWIEPLTSWGEGTLELVEIPSPVEYNDNIVAYWVPTRNIAANDELRFRYRLTALVEEPKASLLRVTATRVTPAAGKKPQRFVVDFEGATLDLSSDASVRPQCTARGGEVKNLKASLNQITGGWRVIFDVEPHEGEPKDIRLYLEAGGKPVSETWVQEL